MEIDSKGLSDYIKSVLQGISGGLPEGYFASSGVRIEVGLRSEVTKEGGVRLTVIKAGGEVSKAEEAKVTFEIMHPLSLAEKDTVTEISQELVNSLPLEDKLNMAGLKPAQPKQSMLSRESDQPSS